MEQLQVDEVYEETRAPCDLVENLGTTVGKIKLTLKYPCYATSFD